MKSNLPNYQLCAFIIISGATQMSLSILQREVPSWGPMRQERACQQLPRIGNRRSDEVLPTYDGLRYVSNTISNVTLAVYFKKSILHVAL